MPYRLAKMKGGYEVTSPNHPEGHAKKGMTKKNAAAQMRLLQAVEHNPKFRPRKG